MKFQSSSQISKVRRKFECDTQIKSSSQICVSPSYLRVTLKFATNFLSQKADSGNYMFVYEMYSFLAKKSIYYQALQELIINGCFNLQKNVGGRKSNFRGAKCSPIRPVALPEWGTNEGMAGLIRLHLAVLEVTFAPSDILLEIDSIFFTSDPEFTGPKLNMAPPHFYSFRLWSEGKKSEVGGEENPFLHQNQL